MPNRPEVIEILDCIRKSGGAISKKQIFGGMKISWGTLCSTVKLMLDHHILSASEPERLTRGRPQIPLNLIPTALYFCGIDIGASTTKIVICDLMFRVHWNDCIATESYKGKDSFTTWIVNIVHKALDNSGQLPIAAVGLSISGTVDSQNGVIISGGNWGMPYGENLAVSELEDLLGLKCYAVNTQIASVCAEYHFGKYRYTPDIVNIGLGVGIGSGVVSNSQLLYSRPQNLVGYIGHMLMPGNPYRCHQSSCNYKGCLEAYCGGENLKRIAMALHPNDQELHGAEKLDRAASEGNEKAIAILDQAASYNAIGIATMIQSYSPDVVIFSGSQVQEDGFLYKSTLRHLYDIIPQERRNFKVAITSLGKLQAARGAARLAFEHFFRSC